MKPAVHIADQSRYEPQEIRARVRKIMEKDSLSVKGKSVFLKPSFVYPARPPLNRAVNTQPEFVGGVAHALRDMGAARVWVGEDSLLGPSQAGFLAMGVLPYIRDAAEPVYLQDERRVEVKVKDALVEDSFNMPEKLMDADLFITLPKLKVNMHAKLTLSVKNHIGLLLARDRLSNHHYNIHKKIADLYRTRMPDYVITDAIQAGEAQGPMHAQPAPLHVILAGKNGVATDSIACRLMGYDPMEIEHLVHLYEQGLGPVDDGQIEVEGRDLLHERARRFTRPRTDFHDYHRSMKFIIGTKLACPSGCVGMIRGSLDRWASVNRWKPLKGLSFIIGKPIDHIPDGLKKSATFVIGDCAEEHKHLGTHIPGCPIPPLAITYALLRKGISGPVYTRARDIARGYVMHALNIPVR